MFRTAITILSVGALAAIGIATTSCATRHGTPPWPKRVGIDVAARNATTVYIRASIDDVAAYFVSVGLRGTRDAVGKQVELHGDCLFSFQIRGQVWTQVVGEPWPNDGEGPFPSGTLDMSRKLHCEVIRLSMSDTAGMIGYSIADCGRLVEQYCGTESSEPFEVKQNPGKFIRYELPPPANDPDYRAWYYVWRSEGERDPLVGSSIWDIADRMLRARKAYDPGIDAAYFIGTDDFRPRGSYTVRNDGLVSVSSSRTTRDIPKLARVDFWKRE